MGAVPSATAADEALAVAEKLQQAFTNVVEKAKPAVVVITNKQVAPQAVYPQMPPEFWRFFGLPMEPPGDGRDPRRGGPQRGGPQRNAPRQRPQVAGKGSGVIIRADGYIVTNYHVIRDNTALEVRLDDGRVFDNERNEKDVIVVGVDEDTDLAVLRIGNGALTDLPTLELADSEAVRVGEFAIAIGAPFNLDYSVTIGHISQKGRYDVGMTTFENYLQTDASINPGNSGGPLLNIRGDVVGLNNFIVTGGGMSRGSIGLGFAISSNLVRQVSESLIRHGEVIRPFLGISMQALDENLKRQFGVDQGVLVSEAMTGDPAEKAGIRAGDVVTKIGGKPVRSPNDLLFAVLAYAPGDKIHVEVVRQGKTMTFDVVARRRGTQDTVATQPDEPSKGIAGLGLGLEQDDDGVVVMEVQPGSAAEKADLRRGDRILEVNQVPVKTTADVDKAFARTRDNVVVFYVDRRGRKRYVGIELDNASGKGGQE